MHAGIGYNIIEGNCRKNGGCHSADIDLEVDFFFQAEAGIRDTEL